jgi:hypothetical protein
MVMEFSRILHKLGAQRAASGVRMTTFKQKREAQKELPFFVTRAP